MAKKHRTALELLSELDEFVARELYRCQPEEGHVVSYNGLQQAKAYRRVQQRLSPIVSRLRVIRDAVSGLHVEDGEREL